VWRSAPPRIRDLTQGFANDARYGGTASNTSNAIVKNESFYCIGRNGSGFLSHPLMERLIVWDNPIILLFANSSLDVFVSWIDHD
jgi:hypothetical protein